MTRLAAAAAMAAVLQASSHDMRAGTALENDTLTAIPGIKVGHVTFRERPTGCTVVLIEAGAVGGVDVRGGAPGTRETDLLSPLSTVDRVHGIVLSGGSAFGLDAASGVVRWLEERGIGFATRAARVPIVPAAILYDLGLGDPRIRPTADCGYRAAAAAGDAPVAQGSVGAGAGATVGKIRGPGHAMRGGIGSAAVRLPDGVVVAALAAVNAFGDIVDPATARIVAGARGDDGRSMVDARRLLRQEALRRFAPGANTTLVVAATNARLTKAEAAKMAAMAHDGIARAVAPSHTPVDGDTVFALATGEREPGSGVLVIGSLAADVTAEAILRGVRHATAAEGIPAVRDLAP